MFLLCFVVVSNVSQIPYVLQLNFISKSAPNPQKLFLPLPQNFEPYLINKGIMTLNLPSKKFRPLIGAHENLSYLTLKNNFPLTKLKITLKLHLIISMNDFHLIA